jgi:hypothetical protein
MGKRQPESASNRLQPRFCGPDGRAVILARLLPEPCIHSPWEAQGDGDQNG